MLDERDLQAIQALIEASENRMNKRLDELKRSLDETRESLGEVRDATNYMVEWIERVEKKVDAAV